MSHRKCDPPPEVLTRIQTRRNLCLFRGQLLTLRLSLELVQTVPHLVRVVSLRVPVPQIGTPALTGIGFSGSTVWNCGSGTGLEHPLVSLLVQRSVCNLRPPHPSKRGGRARTAGLRILPQLLSLGSLRTADPKAIPPKGSSQWRGSVCNPVPRWSSRHSRYHPVGTRCGHCGFGDFPPLFSLRLGTVWNSGSEIVGVTSPDLGFPQGLHHWLSPFGVLLMPRVPYDFSVRTN